MSEQEPGMILDMGGNEFEATRDNSALYRHIGKYAMYDHAFFIRNAEEGRAFYIFSVHPSFEQLAEYMVENEYPTHLNLRQVAQVDAEAYDQMVEQEVDRDVEGGVPEEWL